MSLVSRRPCGPRGVGTAWCPRVVPGWVYRWGPRVAIPGTTQPLGSHLQGPRYQRSGPRKPQWGLEWVGIWGRPGTRLQGHILRVPGTPAPTPAGPGRSPWQGPSLVLPGQKGEIPCLSSKSCQNRRVSPKSHEKAYHSPCFQNGLRNSPLDFLRFLFSLAFSPKELMGPF